MASVYLVWGGTSWYFDVTENEQHEGTLRVTEHPVESGPNITEHTRKELNKFQCDVFVSNTPIDDVNNYGGQGPGGPWKQIQLDPSLTAPYDPPFSPTPGGVSSAIEGAVSGAVNALLGVKKPSFTGPALTWSSPFDQVGDTLAQLQFLQDNATLLTVYTSKTWYENMILEKFELKRSKDEGTGARIRMNFRELRLVQLAFTNAPAPTEARGKSSKSAGSKTPVDAGPKRDIMLQTGAELGFLK